LWKLLPILLEGVKNESIQIRSNYLAALALQLKHLPKAVLLHHIPTLFPYLLQSLRSDSPITLNSTLDSFDVIIQEAQHVVHEHISTIVPLLLALTQYKASMKVRTAALQCLTHLSKLPVAYIFPFKNLVINGLVNVLDDIKRSVRREAVNCRNVWFTTTEPKQT